MRLHIGARKYSNDYDIHEQLGKLIFLYIYIHSIIIKVVYVSLGDILKI